LGFYDENGLAAILDLITDYPDAGSAFIGWFMVDAQLQGQGIGSQIFADLRAAMKAQGYDYLSLAVLPENTEAISFWQKQGFRFSGEDKPWNGRTVSVMERDI
ncbi:MAG: GNAT family N-acetyltransferase, partial [Oscillospiraceae bacterium]|nr:GNAT family N-acetyltransferase [Oscillospiraceae bacterium]